MILLRRRKGKSEGLRDWVYRKRVTDKTEDRRIREGKIRGKKEEDV